MTHCIAQDDDDGDEPMQCIQLSQCVLSWTQTSAAEAAVVRGGLVDVSTWLMRSVERRSKQPSAEHRGE